MKHSFNEYMQLSLQQIQQTTNHIHSGLEFLIVIKGQVELEVNGNAMLLERNDMVLINRNQIHRIKSSQNNLVFILDVTLHFLENHCPKILSYSYDCNSALAHESESQRYTPMKQNMTQMLLHNLKRDEGYEMQMMAQLYELMMYLFKHFRLSETGIENPNLQKDYRLERILSYIHENYLMDISLNELAQQEYMSVHYLSKFFKKHVGINFSDYLNELRLTDAVSQLLYSDDPILKIAFQSGFPNVKSFHNAFVKKYEETPNEYRKQHKKIRMEDTESAVKQIEVDAEEGLAELIRYMIQYDLHVHDQTETKVPHTILFDQQKPVESTNQKMIRIGDFNRILHQKTQNQLRKLKDEIEFQYIYLENFFDYTTALMWENVLGGFSPMVRGIDFLREMNYLPFIQICFAQFHSTTELMEQIRTKLVTAMNQYGKHYVSQWYFDIRCEKDNILPTDYEQVLRAIRELLPESHVGLFLPTSSQDTKSGKVLEYLSAKGLFPDFVTIENDPNKNEQKEILPFENKKLAENYHKEQIKETKQLLKQNNCPLVPIFVTSFNTLAGQNIDLAGTFFRAAIIYQVIQEYIKENICISFWLDVHSCNTLTSTKQPDYSIMSLYLYQEMKRPVFFLLSFLEKMGTLWYQQEKDYLATKVDDKYYILLCNPSYIDPLYSFEKNHMMISSNIIKAVVKGLDSGTYLIKKRLLDQNHGGIYQMLHDLNGFRFIDQESIDFIEKNLTPSFHIWDEEVKEQLILSTDLSLNAIVLYEIQKNEGLIDTK